MPGVVPTRSLQAAWLRLSLIRIRISVGVAAAERPESADPATTNCGTQETAPLTLRIAVVWFAFYYELPVTAAHRNS